MAEDKESSSSSSDESYYEVQVHWCVCGRCSTTHLTREKECVCCSERTNTKEKSTADETGTVCVTNNRDYQVLCLNPVVLTNVLVGLNNVRADNWNVDPADNQSLRYAAYRQFTWWVHGKLGVGRRKVIPACVVHNVRENFPTDPNDTYTGFISGENSDTE